MKFNRNSINTCRPLFFNLSIKKDKKEFKNLLKKISLFSDDYKEQLREYFASMNPSLVFSKNFAKKFDVYIRALSIEAPLDEHGIWVYFPWNNSISHILEEKPFFEVRTSRNKNLITKQEQEKFYHSSVGIAGLSVGNSVALAIILQGGAKNIRLADFDRLALSNTNRIRTGIQNLGEKKVVITARQIYELNPYANVDMFEDGLTENNIKKFFDRKPKLDIVIDEIDNLAMKYLIRECAKQRKLPVVMAADNGDNGVVDIERYDLDQKFEFFHGRMGKVSYKMLSSLDKKGIGMMIAKHIGKKNIPQRMMDSLDEVGKTLVSWPQLGGAALLNGSAVAYCVRKILNGQQIEDNRGLISLDEKFTSNE